MARAEGEAPAASVVSSAPSSVASGASVVAPPRELRCPLCKNPPGPGSLRIVSWTEASGLVDLIRGRTRWRGQITEGPAPCAGCAGWLTRRRLSATLLFMLPLVPLAASLAFESTVFLGALSMFAYYSYVVGRWPSYSWADSMLYGGHLRAGLGSSLPSGERVHFPIHWLHTFARVVAAMLFGFVAAIVALALGHS